MTTKSIVLDVWEPNDVRVKVNQGEINARFLQIKITDKGKALDLTGKTVIFYATKPDDNIIFNSCEILDAQKGLVNLALTSQMSIVAGIMRDCEIDVLDAGKTKLKIKGITLEVCRTTNFETAVKSTSEFTVLDMTLEKAKEIMDAYSEENIMKKITSMDGEDSGLDADLLDGKHGKEYATETQGKKADSAVQGITGNGVEIPPDFNNIVNITPNDIGAVPKSRRINNMPLSDDITLTPQSIGAASENHGTHIPAPQTPNANVFLRNDNSWQTITPQDIGAATSTQGTKADSAIQGVRVNGVNLMTNSNQVIDVETAHLGAASNALTINGQTLTEDIILTASDIGAATVSQGEKADSAIQGIRINGVKLTANSSQVINIDTADLGAASNSLTINGQTLTEDITLTASDVGAATAKQGQKADSAVQGLRVNGVNLSANINQIIDLETADLGAVPITRKINNQSLVEDIKFTASDIGAATASQGTKADSAIQGIMLNGKEIEPNSSRVVDILTSALEGATAEQWQKADTAIQGVKGNGSIITPNSDNIVNVTPHIIGAVPVTRTVNGKSLAIDVTLTHEDIGAATIEQGQKADSAIQGVKVNGAMIASDDEKIVNIPVSKANTYTAAITTTWTAEDNTGYYQNISVPGILDADVPIVDLVQSTDIETAKRELEGWCLVSKITTQADSITVYCYENAPTVEINIKLMCIR